MSLAVTIVAWVLAAFVIVVGVAHLVTPAKGGAAGPRVVAGQACNVHVSGVAEVVIGIGLLVPAPWAAGVAALKSCTLVHLDVLRSDCCTNR